MLRMSELNRNASKVLKVLVEQDDDSVYTTKDCSIFIPKKWLNTKLARIEERFYVLSILMVKVGNDYGTLNVATIIELGLTDYQTTLIDNVECIEFKYSAGEVVIKNLNAPIDNTLPYSITNIVTKKGCLIPYLSYDEFVRIPETFPKFSNLGTSSYAYTVIYMAYVCRAVEDLRLRANLSKKNGYKNIPLSSVQLAVENTLNKFSGGYLDEGVQSALINPSEKASMSEVILRS